MGCRSVTFITAVILIFATISCMSDAMGESETDEFSKQVILWAGKNIEAGTVTVWNDGEEIYVKYETTEGWFLTETHLAISTELERIPQTKNGNPKVGHFPYQTIHDPPTSEYTYEIELDPSYKDGTELVIASHSVVVKLNNRGKVIKEETAWGGDLEFPGKSWATYFKYDLDLPTRPNLPEDSINMMVGYPSQESYFSSIITDIPSGYNIVNGEYNGWCVDSTVFIYPNVDYEVTIYSSFDPTAPDSALDDEQWDMINYILNHKHPEADLFDIQQAIWYFGDDEIPLPSDPEAQAMVDDALLNGVGFKPAPGEVMAVICNAGEAVQLTIFEIEL